MHVLYNKRIKPFFIDGVLADDSVIPKKRAQYQHLVDSHMRISGYVPVLDLDPQFYIEYNSDKDVYNFKYVVFGVYVGKKKSSEYVGYSGNVLVPR